MKSHKMYLVLALLLTIAVVATACTPKSENVTLRLLTNWGPDDSKGPVLDGIIADFQTANPNITIEKQLTTDQDMPTVVETGYLGGEEPEIILSGLTGASQEWVADGVAVSLSQYIKDWGLDATIKPSALTQYTYKGALIAVPLEGFRWPMWYRTDVLEMAGMTGAPKTVADLTTLAGVARANNFQPFALGGNDWTGGDWFHTFLATIMSDDDLCTLMANGGWGQNGKVRSLVDQFVAMRNNGVFWDDVEGQTFDTMNTAFFTGKAAMMHGGSWSFAELPDEMQTKVTLGGIPLPEGAYYTKPIEWAAFDAKGVFVTRNGAKQIDSVKKFITFMYQPEVMARYTNEAGMISPLIETPIDESKVPPIFVQALTLDVQIVMPPNRCAGALMGNPWYEITPSFYVPGTTTDQIIAAMDKLYENK
jgi:multiple sugar transport system substrate-binding protein